LTPAAGRHTLAGVDALKLMAALQSPGRPTTKHRSRRLAPFPIAGLKAPLPDLIERDGENAAWFGSR